MNLIPLKEQAEPIREKIDAAIHGESAALAMFALLEVIDDVAAQGQKNNPFPPPDEFKAFFEHVKNMIPFAEEFHRKAMEWLARHKKGEKN